MYVMYTCKRDKRPYRILLSSPPPPAPPLRAPLPPSAHPHHLRPICHMRRACQIRAPQSDVTAVIHRSAGAGRRRTPAARHPSSCNGVAQAKRADERSSERRARPLRYREFRSAHFRLRPRRQARPTVWRPRKATTAPAHRARTWLRALRGRKKLQTRTRGHLFSPRYERATQSRQMRILLASPC